MERYIAVTRLSTTGQKGNWSMPDQLNRITEYANYRKWELDIVISDVASGVDFDKRPGILDSIERIKNKQAEIVIYSDIDRLSRDFGKADEYVRKIYLLGGKIAIAKDNQVCETAYDFLERYNYELYQAHTDRNRIIYRTQSKKLQAFQAGSNIQRPLYGYASEKKTFYSQGISIDGKGLVKHPKRHKAVIEIMDYFLQSRSIYATLKWANEQGFESGLGKDSLNISAITLILKSHSRYAGIDHKETFTYQDKQYSRYIAFPAIISEETSRNVENTLALRDKSAKNDITPFGKLVFCSCGKRAYWQKKQGHNSSFRCASVTLVRQYRDTRVKLPENFCLCSGEIVLNKVKLRTIAELERIVSSDISTTIEHIIQSSITRLVEATWSNISLKEQLDAKQEDSRGYAPTLRRLLAEEKAEYLAIIESEISVLNSEIKELQNKLNNNQDEIQNLYNVLKTYGLNRAKIDNIVSKLVSRESTMISATYEINDTIYFPIVEEITQNVKTLIDEIKNNNWESANQILSSLGLVLVIPLGEADVTARTAGVRLEIRPATEAVKTRKKTDQLRRTT